VVIFFTKKGIAIYGAPDKLLAKRLNFPLFFSQKVRFFLSFRSTFLSNYTFFKEGKNETRRQIFKNYRACGAVAGSCLHDSFLPRAGKAGHREADRGQADGNPVGR
jgi:hypothetical protein